MFLKRKIYYLNLYTTDLNDISIISINNLISEFTNKQNGY